MRRKLITPIYLNKGKAVSSLTDASDFPIADAVAAAEDYSNRGSDVLMIFDQSDSDEEHDRSLTLMRRMARLSDVPMWGAGNVRRVEDVKKILYAGCRKAVLNAAKPSNLQMLEEVSKRFGREKIAVCALLSELQSLQPEQLTLIRQYAQDLIILGQELEEGIEAANVIGVPSAAGSQTKEEAGQEHSPTGAGQEQPSSGSEQAQSLPRFHVSAILEKADLSGHAQRLRFADSRLEGIGGAFTQKEDADLMGLKALMKEDGMTVNLFESAFSWEDLHKGENGLIPVVVQDYRNEEVLMVAYMNQEAYEKTLRTGVMTYWSRSRQELWVKGLTSGHFQYLKELRVDCDNDTLLARVAQVGAACHTGNRSCFYRTALRKDTPQRNPMAVFEDVYATIEDRRQHPKEGSYTNYLFDKGIDKILKKCGEEAAEIIIAAKNPNPEESKYEMADFLYHMMVLMSERGITWDDIAQELANRE